MKLINLYKNLRAWSPVWYFLKAGCSVPLHRFHSFVVLVSRSCSLSKWHVKKFWHIQINVMVVLDVLKQLVVGNNFTALTIIPLWSLGRMPFPQRFFLLTIIVLILDYCKSNLFFLHIIMLSPLILKSYLYMYWMVC